MVWVHREFIPIIGWFNLFTMVIRVSQKVLISFREIQGVCSGLERSIGAFRVSRVFQGGYRVFQGGYRDLQGLTERFDHFHGVPSIYFETNLGLFLYFTLYYKTRQRLLQNAAGITKRGKGSYKTRQVLQNAASITKRGSTRGIVLMVFFKERTKFEPNWEWLHFEDFWLRECSFLENQPLGLF